MWKLGQNENSIEADQSHSQHRAARSAMRLSIHQPPGASPQFPQEPDASACPLIYDSKCIMTARRQFFLPGGGGGGFIFGADGVIFGAVVFFGAGVGAGGLLGVGGGAGLVGLGGAGLL